ncbi:hypothetical protein GN956_G22072 [Arapaima gigas]
MLHPGLHFPMVRASFQLADPPRHQMLLGPGERERQRLSHHLVLAEPAVVSVEPQTQPERGRLLKNPVPFFFSLL